jgi:pimeloyl-ACP methyl ester carboxylesterase
MHGDAFFTVLTTPVAGKAAARLPPPPLRLMRRSMRSGAVGPRAERALPDEWFETVIATMRMPGWSVAMRSHLGLAMRMGRPRTENSFGDDETRRIAAPVLLVWGEDDVYGGPDIGRRACELLPDGRLEVIPGRHAPFLDDPAGCGAMITAHLAAAGA